MYADEERNYWRKCFENGITIPNHYLDEYRKHRDDPTWRSTRSLEYLCEYILFLEEQLTKGVNDGLMDKKLS